MLEPLLDRFRRRDRLALSRLLTLVSHGDHLEEIRSALELSRDGMDRQRPARVVAITGSAGVGKSTLVGKLIDELRGQGKSVAVLACDPQSPLTGGALLGDRFRMPSQPDDGVFIRSLATASGQGSVAKHLQVMLLLLERFGFDVILIETVGAGQGDTAVRELADAVVLLLQPETGDDLQWEKAGLLEVADAVVIHKADLPGADRVESQVRAALELSESASAPIVRVSSKSGDGIKELAMVMTTCALRQGGDASQGRELLRLAQEVLFSRFRKVEADKDSHLNQLIDDWRQGRCSNDRAAVGLLRLLVPNKVD